ncbi:MAG TPA: 6,7-dimethyl-8-ribityllumazine synthase [Chitinophagaceae bacterium]|nr:6,7-dimethyl-8-ribityllumazine synthase [Chitinophagaceae bacterium]
MSIHNEALFDQSEIEGLEGLNIAIIHTRWNNFIVDELVNGCREVLAKNKVENIDHRQVPGSIELTFACQRYFEATCNTTRRPDAIIAFGCVIKGETPHFDYVCESVTQGITQLNLQLPIPVIFGLLTVNNVAQAKERIGGAHGHKGEEAAISALQMIAFNKELG